MTSVLCFELKDPENTEAGCDYVGHGVARHSSFFTKDGVLLMITHASQDGKFRHGLIPAHLRADGIICCHPAQAQKRYPQLTILGEWETATKVKILGDCLYIFPWDPDYEPC